MITTNVYMRAFHIVYEKDEGTAFLVDIDDRQYMVTAKHLISELNGDGDIQIYYKGAWLTTRIRLVGHADGKIDISVFCLLDLYIPCHPLPPTMDGIVVGQDVFFLGFPYGMQADYGEINRNFPVAFVKKGILSAVIKEEDGSVLYLDAHSNPGFSGGPVVFAKPGIPKVFNVAAVVTGFKTKTEPVYYGTGRESNLTYLYNTGIVRSWSIKHAVDIVKGNPIGKVRPMSTPNSTS